MGGLFITIGHGQDFRVDLQNDEVFHLADALQAQNIYDNIGGATSGIRCVTIDLTAPFELPGCERTNGQSQAPRN